MLVSFILRIKLLIVVCHVLYVCGQGDTFTNRNGTIELFKLASGHSSILRTIEIAPQDFDPETEALAFRLKQLYNEYGRVNDNIHFFEGEISPSNKREVNSESWFTTKGKLFLQLPAVSEYQQNPFLIYLIVSTKLDDMAISSQESGSGVIQKYLAIERFHKLPSFTFRRDKYENMFVRQDSVDPLPMSDCFLTTNSTKEAFSVANEEKPNIFYDNSAASKDVFTTTRYGRNQDFMKGHRYQIQDLNFTLQVTQEDLSNRGQRVRVKQQSESSFERITLCGLTLHYKIESCPNDVCVVRVGSRLQRELLPRFIYGANRQTIQLFSIKDKEVVHAELIFLDTAEKTETVFNDAEKLTSVTFPISRFQDFIRLLIEPTSRCEAFTYLHKNGTATFELVCQ